MSSSQCQCSSECKRPLVSGIPFCRYHLLKGCPRKSPLSGSEPKYDPNIYNGNKSIQHSHNCFAYAFGVVDDKQIKKCASTPDCDVPFHSPGVESNLKRISGKDGKTCSDVVGRSLADSKAGYRIGFTGQCRKGSSKIAVVVDPKRDFHYYRQDSNGLWSHKPGATAVTNKDSMGNPIYDPSLAGRYYPSTKKEDDNELNYTGFCGYYCIPRDKKINIAAGGKRTAVSRAQKATRRKTRSARKTRRHPAQSSRTH